MAVLQMQRVSICALKRDRKAILEKIQSMGIMEVSQIQEDVEGLEKMNTQTARSKFEKNASLADTALGILAEYVPEKTSMFASLEGKKLVEKEPFLQAVDRKDEIMSAASGILAQQRKIAEYKANIQKLENQIEALAPWMCLWPLKGLRLLLFLWEVFRPVLLWKKFIPGFWRRLLKPLGRMSGFCLRTRMVPISPWCV